MTTTKVRKKMKLKQGISAILNANKTEIAMETKFSVDTVTGWIYYRPYKLDFPFVLKAIKKHTGLTREDIFDFEEK